jgi:NTP pyrophosphatase (non-canonical NTP hydrolase)
MEIKESQKQVDEIIRHYGGYWEPLSMLARLTEEVGELSRAMNIQFGGKKKKFVEDGNELGEEIADVLFTTLALANATKIDASEELTKKIKKDWEKCKGVYDEN